jgi:hypothetical protein
MVFKQFVIWSRLSAQQAWPFYNEPLIAGETGKEYKKDDTVPSLWLKAWMVGFTDT